MPPAHHPAVELQVHVALGRGGQQVVLAAGDGVLHEAGFGGVLAQRAHGPVQRVHRLMQQLVPGEVGRRGHASVSGKPGW